MFVYQKKLQYPVKIATPNPKLAAMIISQYGGPYFIRLRKSRSNLLRLSLFYTTVALNGDPLPRRSQRTQPCPGTAHSDRWSSAMQPACGAGRRPNRRYSPVHLRYVRRILSLSPAFWPHGSPPKFKVFSNRQVLCSYGQSKYFFVPEKSTAIANQQYTGVILRVNAPVDIIQYFFAICKNVQILSFSIDFYNHIVTYLPPVSMVFPVFM